MSELISISDARMIASGYDAGDPLREAILEVIAAAETLRRIHAGECGCEEPGGVYCGWPAADGGLLARFDFDEIEEPA